jgi:hypothetical protein
MEWDTRLTKEAMRPARLRELYAVMSASPPDLRAFPNPVIVGLVQYLRECTGPDDRVFAAWFVPELYFFAQRGFAAGIVAFFGGHWSEPQFQQQSVAALASHSTPILIFETDYYGAFDAEYPILAQYVHEHYGIAGQTAFGVRGVAANGFTVLADKGRRPTYVHPLTSLPCFW